MLGPIHFMRGLHRGTHSAECVLLLADVDVKCNQVPRSKLAIPPPLVILLRRGSPETLVGVVTENQSQWIGSRIR